ncbi:hypothetical protein M8C21_005717 [Ambrosia artemisiifolia]|uniref:Uncharacterized protein n=1 Tax=Ambrosia artemisiifolia TaxID=4212 RepID=A0AAD5GIE2_AMBAR|nr:hypothetical protein M8C21_005717 [Ambrosia artemisiifolia]
MEELTSSAASETSGNDGGLNGFEDHESLFMEFPEGGSSEWTDKKHRLYLSMGYCRGLAATSFGHISCNRCH